MDKINYIERNTNQLKHEIVPGKGLLKWFYNGSIGKATLHLLMKRKMVTVLCGKYMDSRHSTKRIERFIRVNAVNIQECRKNTLAQFTSFNDFFYRKLNANARTIEKNIVSPADGKILVFPSIKDVDSFFIKGTKFNLVSFTQNKNIAQKYADGAMAIIRLAPADYHRFHFPYSGIISPSTEIKGHYFSVSPFALKRSLRIFCENKRAYSTLKTADQGDILITEVGATMVGRITQTYTDNTTIQKGEEKGFFSFGGSTLVLLFENKGGIHFSEDLIINTKKGLETTIKMGETITL